MPFVSLQMPRAKYQCGRCSYIGEKTALAQHYVKIHAPTVDVPFLCGNVDCGQRYNKVKDLRKHITLNHRHSVIDDLVAGTGQTYKLKDGEYRAIPGEPGGLSDPTCQVRTATKMPSTSKQQKRKRETSPVKPKQATASERPPRETSSVKSKQATSPVRPPRETSPVKPRQVTFPGRPPRETSSAKSEQATDDSCSPLFTPVTPPQAYQEENDTMVLCFGGETLSSDSDDETDIVTAISSKSLRAPSPKASSCEKNSQERKVELPLAPTPRPLEKIVRPASPNTYISPDSTRYLTWEIQNLQRAIGRMPTANAALVTEMKVNNHQTKELIQVFQTMIDKIESFGNKLDAIAASSTTTDQSRSVNREARPNHWTRSPDRGMREQFRQIGRTTASHEGRPSHHEDVGFGRQRRHR